MKGVCHPYESILVLMRDGLLTRGRRRRRVVATMLGLAIAAGVGLLFLAPPAAHSVGRAPTPAMQTVRNSQRSGDYRQNTGAWPVDSAEPAALLAQREEGRSDSKQGKKNTKKGPAGHGAASTREAARPGPAGKGRRSAVGIALERVCSLPDTAPMSEIQAALGAAKPFALCARDYTTILSALRSSRKWRMALRLGELLAYERASPPSAAHVEGSRGKGGGGSEPSEVLPNRMHYNVMLAACADAGRRREPAAGSAARTLLELMAERGVTPDSRSFASAIAALDVTAGVEQVTALLAEYEAAADLSLAPAAPAEGATFVYSSAMRACLRVGAWQPALGMLDSMRVAGVQPDAYCLASGLEACRQGRDAGRALAEMRAAREAAGAAAWSGVLVSTAMGACVRAGMWAEALELFDTHAADLKAGARPGAADAVPDPFCLTAALAACRRGAQADRALALLAQAESSLGGAGTAGPGAPVEGGSGGQSGRAGRPDATTRAHMREQTVGACVAAGRYAEAILCHRQSPDPPTARSLFFALEACGALGLSTNAGAQHAAVAIELHAQLPADSLYADTETDVDTALLSALASCSGWPQLLGCYDSLGLKAKASKRCLKLAAQAALALDSPRAAELGALAKEASD